MGKPISRIRPDLRHKSTKQLNRILKKENRKFPENLVSLPKEGWPKVLQNSRVIESWRSSGFLVQIYAEDGGIERLSVCRARIKDDGHYDDKITWEELQRLKSECGRGDKVALEIFPEDKDVVNVANMRHLWIVPIELPFIWKAK